LLGIVKDAAAYLILIQTSFFVKKKTPLVLDEWRLI